jgi:hypothetical protein
MIQALARLATARTSCTTTPVPAGHQVRPRHNIICWAWDRRGLQLRNWPHGILFGSEAKIRWSLLVGTMSELGNDHQLFKLARIYIRHHYGANASAQLFLVG